MSGRAEPRFDLDLHYGREGELRLAECFSWIADGNGKVEVKRKRYLDWEFYVETHCDKGRTGQFEPSGINVTTAVVWVIVIADTGIAMLVPTQELRAMVAESVRERCETDGTCPTRGRLINLAALLQRHRRRHGGDQNQASRSQKPVENHSTDGGQIVDASEVNWG